MEPSPVDAAPTKEDKMGSIVLHVGTHKTGTTTLQGALFEKREALKEKGIYYPSGWEVFGGNRELPSARAHFRFAEALTKTDAASAEKIARFREHILAAATQYRHVVLSAESFYRHIFPDHGQKVAAQAKYDLHEAYLDRLAGFVEGLDSCAVIYFRRPDAFAESMYAESAVNSMNSAPFEKFITADRMRYDYKFHLDALRRRFATRALCFEGAVGTGLLASFFEVLGTDPGEWDARSERVSISKNAVQWIMWQKRAGDMSQQDRRRRWLFALQDEQADLLATPKEMSFWASDEDRSAFNAKALEGFDEFTFPEPRATLTPLPAWTAQRHEAVESVYQDWKGRNEERLRWREANFLAPFVDPNR
jgi:hypothetical protein